MTTPRIVVTPGEPAGIGPDLVARLATRPHPCQIVAVADPGLLRRRARQLGLTLETEPFDPAAPPRPHRPGHLPVAEVALARPEHPGRLDPANGPYVIETLARATDLCLDGTAAALVTAPVHKGVINEAGIPFTGHTEFLAERSGAGQVVMMLATGELRVALVTTHLPLREVADTITAERLERVARILHADLGRLYGIERPRILVCGLNPHAGEEGHLGREEIEIITPVLERLRSEGLDLVGPLPADTLYVPRFLEGADATLAMYHDQGLPVLKHHGFGRAINVTLGMPIIRTSVDHGTALELAGSGRADGTSLEAALQAALEMAERKRSHAP